MILAQYLGCKASISIAVVVIVSSNISLYLLKGKKLDIHDESSSFQSFITLPSKRLSEIILL